MQQSCSSPTPMSSEAAAVLGAPSSLALVATGAHHPSPTASLTASVVNSASSNAARPRHQSPTAIDDPSNSLIVRHPFSCLPRQWQ